MDNWMIILGGILIGVALAGVICFAKGTCKIQIGKLRPQVMVALIALSAIALFTLTDPTMQNVATLSVGGLIALATRIIESD